ncbi:MAG: hypothetical protein PVF70_04960 [Anaerolineales bacterium]
MIQRQSLPASLARKGILGIDWILRRHYRVAPFTQKPGCILRLSAGYSNRSFQLSDGTEVQEGDPILHIHLWSERLKDLASMRNTLGWGQAILSHMRSSLSMLVEFLDQHPRPEDWVAVRGEYGFITQVRSAEGVLKRLGFDLAYHEFPGMRIWRRAFWDNLYSYFLMWTFNPDNVKGKRLADLARLQFWISRAKLEQRYRA